MPKKKETQDAEPASSETKLPKSLGAVVDLFYKTRQERYELQHKLDAMKKIEAACEERIINELPKSESTGIAGKTARAAVNTKKVPQVSDWGSLYGYIIKNKAFDLLQKRLSTKAVEERWEAGKKLPGVEVYNAVTVSLTKV